MKSIINKTTAFLAASTLPLVTMAVGETGAEGTLATKTSSLFTNVFDPATQKALGLGLTIVGTVILIWKFLQIIFNSSSWAESSKVIFGAVILMVMGSNFEKVVSAVIG